MKNYLFLNTRKQFWGVEQVSMAEQVNRWVDYIFAPGPFCYPKVWTDPTQDRQAQDVTQAIRSSNPGKLIAINFGVGGNSRKHLGPSFEADLLLALLDNPDVSILLDKGYGTEEVARSRKLLAVLTAHGHRCDEQSFHQRQALAENTRVVAVESTIGQMASLIRQCDEFIGYDSACQHIAAAMNVPGITLFAGTNNPRFIRRWSAAGPGPVNIVHVNTLSGGEGIDNQEIIQRVLQKRAVIDS